MRSPSFRLLGMFLVLALFWGPVELRAQQDEEQGQQELPEIAPQEIEIRGDLQLSFPSLQRQPLRGFAPSTTIPSVPPNRTPFVEAYKQRLSTLPDSLPTPEPISRSIAVDKQSQMGFLEMGAGRYLSRFARGRVSLPIASKQRLALELDYTGTDGFSPFAGSDVTTPADELEGSVRFETRHDRVSFAADVHGRADQYTLYGVPTLAADPSAVAPDRSGSAGGAELHLATRGTLQSTLDVFYGWTQFNTQLDLSGTSAGASYIESRLGTEGSAEFSLGPRTARVDVKALRSRFDGDLPSHSGYSINGGASVSLLQSEATTVRGGARVLAFESPVAPEQPDSRTVSSTFVVPQGRAELRMDPSFTLYAENAPDLSKGTLSDVYDQSPYAEHAPSVRPLVTTTNLEAGVTLSSGALRLQANSGYRYAPSFRYFQRAAPGAGSPRLFEVSYGSARILRVGGQVALQGINGFTASVRVGARDGSLVGDDTDIPYFSPITTSAMLSYTFADQRGHVQTTGTIEGPRPTDPSGTTEVGTYVAFDLEGSYQLTSSLDAVFRIQNISPNAPTKWARYPRPPAMVMGGVRIRW